MENVNNLKNSFIELIKVIKRQPNSLLVIAGDVFENKTFLTTDEIYIFYWMMEGLKQKGIQTVIIPGNHDYNINSVFKENNIEVLTRNFDNVHCLSSTQIYSIDNIDFYVYSPIDKQSPPVNSSNIDHGRIKVALLHEPVNDALFDSGESITGARFNIAEFAKYDFTMLGDIHKPQFLNPRIAYAGSFIQKNKGEGLDHGYILWDLKNKSGKHHFIPLKEIYLKLEAHDDKCITPELTSEQKIKYISLFHKNCTSEYLTQLKTQINDKYGIINKMINKDSYNMAPVIKLDDMEIKQTKTNYEVNQFELIKEILKGKSEELISQICAYHSEKIQNRKEINYTQYKIVYMYWNNVFCYGANNFIDFRNFKQNIVLLNGKNKQGKSTVIDILLRVLFNEAERGYKEDVINKHCKTGDIKLCFMIGNDEYTIQQNLSIDGKSNSHRLFKNGENITKHSIVETYKYIKYDLGIGDYKDFINLTTALQNRKFLIDLDKRELLNLLTKILNVDVLHDLEKETTSELSLLKRINRKIITEYDTLEQFTAEEKTRLTNKLVMLSERSVLIEQELVKINDNIIELNKQLPMRYSTQLMTHPTIQEIADRINRLRENLRDAPDVNRDTITELEIEIEVLSRQYNISNEDMYAAKHPSGFNPTIEADIKSAEAALADVTQTILHLEAHVYKPSKDTEALFKVNTFNKAELEAMATSMEESTEILQAKRIEHADVDTNASKDELYSLVKPHISRYAEYKHFISASLPNYKELRSTRNTLAKKVSEYRVKFGNLIYNDQCQCCSGNRSIMNNIINIADEEANIHSIDKVLNEQDANERKYKDCKRFVYLIDLYNNKCIQQVLDARDILREYKNSNEYSQLSDLRLQMKTHAVELISHKATKLKFLFWCLKQKKIREELAECEAQKAIAIKAEKKTKKINEILDALYISKAELTSKLTANKERRERYLVRESLVSYNLQRKAEIEAEQKKNLDQIEFLQYYNNCINHKNGIPSLILRNVSHLLDKRCNEILHKIADFEVEFKYDKEFKIYTCENGAKIPAVMGSGFQKFLLDMIMRITLTNISVLSNPSIIFIDEGFGCLDAENFIEVAQILTKLKNNFDAMIIITHLQELKAYTDITIDIKVVNTFSILHSGSLTESEKNVVHKAHVDDVDIKIDDVMILFDLTPDGATCKACKKTLKRTAESTLLKHFTAKTGKKRHDKYLIKLASTAAHTTTTS